MQQETYREEGTDGEREGGRERKGRRNEESREGGRGGREGEMKGEGRERVDKKHEKCTGLSLIFVTHVRM